MNQPNNQQFTPHLPPVPPCIRLFHQLIDCPVPYPPTSSAHPRTLSHLDSEILSGNQLGLMGPMDSQSMFTDNSYSALQIFLPSSLSHSPSPFSSICNHEEFHNQSLYAANINIMALNQQATKLGLTAQHKQIQAFAQVTISL